MDSAPSNSEPSAFSQLHSDLQRWIWDQKWGELRAAQAQAIPAILGGQRDVIISAATASGKTEAALLPMLSGLAGHPATSPGVEILYLSPLKALINDQFDRLTALAGAVDVAVHRWHGDVAGDKKAEVLRKPTGVLLITPESLEALFVLRGSQISTLFGALRYVVVDELHSFIGTERGAQLQSQLHRLELAIRRRVPRIALSATLGDMSSAAEHLRPGAGAGVLHLVDEADGQALKLQVRGYTQAEPDLASQDSEGGDDNQGAIARDIFDALRGSDNLIFANSRRNVEIYADLLTNLCAHRRVPNEFFAHHGSLSKELREFVEARLKESSQPANAVCTSTLEMGIDIGDVRSIVQIGAPPAVASLRQRLGRSGRRGDAAVLRVYISEDEVTSTTPPPDALRAELVQSVAMVNLLLQRWYEPSIPGDLHLSTLIQQLLSVIAQHGGVLASDAYSALCRSGPFSLVTPGQFAELLRSLGAKELLQQSSDGTLLHGPLGERIVNHYSFYAAFQSVEEWRLVSDGHTLGTLPIDFPLSPGLFLIFAGRRWRVTAVDGPHKVVDLVAAPGGRPPVFSGAGPAVDHHVRGEMLRVYQSGEIPAYLDAEAARLLTEARQNFARFRLYERRLLAHGEDTYIFLWAGDRIVNTVISILAATDLKTTRDGLALSVTDVSPIELSAQLMALLVGEQPDPIELAATVANKAVQKYDGFLSESLQNAAYAANSLDVPGAWNALQSVVDSTVSSDG
jgi:ATP-dependent helicase Lhr and Lhr-like helicase